MKAKNMLLCLLPFSSVYEVSSDVVTGLRFSSHAVPRKNRADGIFG